MSVKIFYNYRDNNLIYRVPDMSLIDLEVLNNEIVKNLRERGDLTSKETVKRAVKLNHHFFFVDGYATLHITEMNWLVNKFFKKVFSSIIMVRDKTLYEVLPSNLSNRLPKPLILQGSQCGGSAEDSTDIDVGIKPLVRTLNLIPNLETFSSCDGHGKNVLYILWQIKGSQEDAGKVLEILEDSFTEHYYNYFESTVPNSFQQGTLKGVTINFFCGYGRWQNRKGIYYEVRIFPNYKAVDKYTVFNFISEVSVVTLLNKIKYEISHGIWKE